MSDTECKSCIHESTIAELRKDSERNSEQHREFYKKLGELDTSIVLANERYSNVLAGINELKLSVNELKDKPAKKWDSVAMTIISCIVTGIVIFLLSKVGI